MVEAVPAGNLTASRAKELQQLAKEVRGETGSGMHALRGDLPLLEMLARSLLHVQKLAIVYDAAGTRH